MNAETTLDDDPTGRGVQMLLHKLHLESFRPAALRPPWRPISRARRFDYLTGEPLTMRCIKCAGDAGYKRVCDTCRKIKERMKKKPIVEELHEPPPLVKGHTRAWSNRYYSRVSETFRPQVIFAATIPDDNKGMLEACPWLR